MEFKIKRCHQHCRITHGSSPQAIPFHRKPLSAKQQQSISRMSHWRHKLIKKSLHRRSHRARIVQVVFVSIRTMIQIVCDSEHWMTMKRMTHVQMQHQLRQQRRWQTEIVIWIIRRMLIANHCSMPPTQPPPNPHKLSQNVVQTDATMPVIKNWSRRWTATTMKMKHWSQIVTIEHNHSLTHSLMQQTKLTFTRTHEIKKKPKIPWEIVTITRAFLLLLLQKNSNNSFLFDWHQKFRVQIPKIITLAIRERKLVRKKIHISHQANTLNRMNSDAMGC